MKVVRERFAKRFRRSPRPKTRSFADYDIGGRKAVTRRRWTGPSMPVEFV